MNCNARKGHIIIFKLHIAQFECTRWGRIRRHYSRYGGGRLLIFKSYVTFRDVGRRDRKHRTVVGSSNRKRWRKTSKNCERDPCSYYRFDHPFTLSGETRRLLAVNRHAKYLIPNDARMVMVLQHSFEKKIVFFSFLWFFAVSVLLVIAWLPANVSWVSLNKLEMESKRHIRVWKDLFSINLVDIDTRNSLII